MEGFNSLFPGLQLCQRVLTGVFLYGRRLKAIIESLLARECRHIFSSLLRGTWAFRVRIWLRCGTSTCFCWGVHLGRLLLSFNWNGLDNLLEMLPATNNLCLVCHRVREVLSISFVDEGEYVLELAELPGRKKCHLLCPDRLKVHVLSSDGDDRDGEQQGFNFHELWLLDAEICEKLSIFTQICSLCFARLEFGTIELQNKVCFEEAAMRQKQIDKVIYWVLH